VWGLGYVYRLARAMTSVVDGQQRFFAAYARLSQMDNINNHVKSMI